MWQGETLAVKQVYMEQARLKQEEHSLMYPGEKVQAHTH